MFIRDGAKKKQFSQKMRKYELQSIEQENAEIGMRLKMKKSFLDVKRMDEEYKNEHQKILDKSFCTPYYFFLFAIVLAGPLRVLAFVFVLCPLTGRPFLCLVPR